MEHKEMIIKLIFSLFLLFPSLAFAAAATGNGSTQANTSTWTVCGNGTGPLYFQLTGGIGGGNNMLVVFGASTPSSTATGLRIDTSKTPFYYSGSNNVYVLLSPIASGSNEPVQTNTGYCTWSAP